jgi:radical SAM superfamily enzyme YgiQ (UPF0313 family)
LRLLLLLPGGQPHRLRFGPWARSFREAPLTLTTLAALVPSELHAEIRLVDGSIEPIPLKEKFDLVGISCMTGTSQKAYQLADHYRAHGATVVLGGVHATLRPDEAHCHADVVVRGFAEQTWPLLLRDFVSGNLRREYYSPKADLAGLPMPRRDLQHNWGYMMPNTVFATRGCRSACDFCAVPAAGFGWQTRPVSEVIDEIRSLPGRRFAFNDVSLNEDRDYARELFTALIPLKKLWGGLATTRIAQDEELLDLMAASGCVFLLLGFESVTQDNLDEMGKRFNRAQEYAQVAEALHRRGIIIQGCFIFGLDQDTPEVFEQTVAVVNELRIDIPRYALYTPFPGTRAFDRLKQEGRVLHEDWEHYDTQHVVIQPRQMTPEELDAGFIRAYQQTFTLRSIWNRTASAKQFAIAFVGNLAYRRYVRRLSKDLDRIRRQASGH